MSTVAKRQSRQWLLEGFLDSGGELNRMPLNRFPARIGRQAGLELTLEAGDVSRLHAIIQRKGRGLAIRDLGSTNGTFVNLEPVQNDMVVRAGDIIHFGAVEMRLVAHYCDSDLGHQVTRHGTKANAGQATGSRALREVLVQDKITALFQAIFTAEGKLHGWEILGRGDHPALSNKPAELFRLAESVGEAVSLSESFRRVGVARAAQTHPGDLFFINTHPTEMVDAARFLQNMRKLRQAYPQLGLVVELHEAAFGDVRALATLRDALLELDMRLAFDDFGAGQARLLELADAPPHYIKLDISLVKNIDRVSEARREMVKMILAFAHRADSQVIAEGVSRAGEAQACRTLGFDLLQGYYVGRPVQFK